jgi:FdhE protein
VERQTIEERIQNIVQRTPAYQELCQLVGELLLHTLEQDRPEDLPQPQSDTSRWKQGRSLWDRGRLELDWPRRWELAIELAQVVADRPGGAETVQALAGLRADAGPQGGEGAGAFRAVLTGDGKALERAARKHGGQAPVLGLLLRLALRPALLAAAHQARQQLELEAWSFGHCPVCGSAPGLATLSGEGGQRTLYCSLCETAWPYPRLQCPFCESQEPGIFSYLKPEDEPGLQVDLCARCGQYLKTLDLRELAGPVIPPLDEAATWHLDLIARRHRQEGTPPEAEAKDPAS